MNQTPEGPKRVHRRRVQADMPQPEMTKSARSRPTRKAPKCGAQPLRRFWYGVSPLIRLVIVGLAAALFLTLTVAVTSDYMARQEERRRLEAEAAERAQHPLLYADLIIRYADEFSLDPALVSAIILSESSFNPNAQSAVSAHGLMQLMPETAGWIAGKLDEDSNENHILEAIELNGNRCTIDLLFDPETNIRYGTWYLGYLSRRFDGDATKIVCAYHAGQGNVDSWLSKPEYSHDGVTLDVIPMENTATYAARVLKARDVYQKYYFPGPQSSADPS